MEIESQEQKEIQEINNTISLGLELLGDLINQLHKTDSRRIDLETAKKRMEKFSVSIPDREGVCPDCETYNQTWIQRSKTVKRDFVYCWHCGKRVFIKHKENGEL